jgi:hypothetical protein
MRTTLFWEKSLKLTVKIHDFWENDPFSKSWGRHCLSSWFGGGGFFSVHELEGQWKIHPFITCAFPLPFKLQFNWLCLIWRICRRSTDESRWKGQNVCEKKLVQRIVRLNTLDCLFTGLVLSRLKDSRSSRGCDKNVAHSLRRFRWVNLLRFSPSRIPGGFCQPQASLQNTAPKSMRSLPHVHAANQRRCLPTRFKYTKAGRQAVVWRWQRARARSGYFQPRF